MATLTKELRVSKDAQAKIIEYIAAILTARRSDQELHTKMEAIDIAYARYKESGCEGDKVCNVFEQDNVIAPIVISQVDSMVGYLSEIFLSGYPIFPVVSNPTNREYAEQLETLIDDHATLGGYARQLLLFLKDGVKYNFSAIEADWTSIDQYNILEDWATPDVKKLDRTDRYYTSIKRLDPYNTIFDPTISLGDNSKLGDYAGHIQILSRVKLKKLIIKLSKDNAAYNANEALSATIGNSVGASSLNYRIHPTVSSYITPRRPEDRVDWEKYITGKGNQSSSLINATNYELVTIYGRIIPSELKIIGPQPNTPQIWKFQVVNGVTLISAKRIITASDCLPILFGQPNEDGLGLQTQSTAENEIPIQEAATTLYNIRFAAARRAVADRALYDPKVISLPDVNSPVPAAKIPVRTAPLEGRTIDAAYKQIPFDMRGTETTLQDAAQLVEFSKQLSGLNNAQQGQFQKGNKSVTEFQTVMGGSDSRLRLPALLLEHQVFMPLKSIIVLNIFQYGQDAIVVSQKNGNVVNINIDALRKQVLAFRVADGYTPKSKLASTEMLTNLMNLIMNSPVLQQSYGPMLPSIVAHLAQLGGVRGLEEYLPTMPQIPQSTNGVPANAQEIGTEAPGGS